MSQPEGQPSPPIRSTPSSVRSAARARPLEAGPKRSTGKRLEEGAADTVLNAFSILREVVEDFRSSDRFFKYKALVIALWCLAAVGAFGVACPTNPSAGNSVDAVLVVGGEASAPIYMIKNESNETWQDIEIVVNGSFRATRSQIAPQGGNTTLSPGVLFDHQGSRAPSNLVIQDIVLRVGQPSAEVSLLKAGRPTK